MNKEPVTLPRRRPFAALIFLFALSLPALRTQAQNNATFVSQNVPSAMVAGQSYSVSVTMRNTGTTTWTDAAQFRLGSQSPQDNVLWSVNGTASSRVSQPLNVPPGGQATFAFVVQPPVPPTGAQTNSYFQWKMVQDGSVSSWFGSPSTVASVAVSLPPGASVNTQVTQGNSSSFRATATASGFDSIGDWSVQGPNNYFANPSNTQGWAVHANSLGVFTVYAPSTAPVGTNYKAFCATRKTSGGTEGPTYYGYSAPFDVTAASVTAPPPAATGAPYPWQGSVGSVNSANGNKITSVPLVGWSGRGGLPIGFALTHNSLGGAGTGYGEPGYKWNTSYHVTATAVNPLVPGGTVAVGWGDGRAYSFVLNNAGVYIAPKGIYDKLTVIVNGGAATAFDLTTKGQVRYHFGSWSATSFFLTSMTDENGNQITINRDGGGRVTSVVDPSGRALTLGYDAGHGGRINFVRDERTGNYWSLGYDANNDLTAVQWPALPAGAPIMALDYNAHNIVAVHDLKGNVTHFIYNSDSTLQSATDACGNQTQFTYYPNFVVTDPNGHPTGHNYTGALLTSVVDTLGKTETYRYDANNNPTTKTDRRGNIWKMAVDARHGDALSSEDPLLHGSSAVYDARNGKPLQKFDALGNATTFVYDVNGINLLSVTDPLGPRPPSTATPTACRPASATPSDTRRSWPTMPTGT